MLKSFLKIFGKSAKKATESVGKTMEFMDDIIEKEYIVNAVESAKEATGDVVEKAGKLYQQTKDNINDNLNNEQLKNTVKKFKEKSEEVAESIKEKMMEQSDTMRNVMEEGEKIIDKVFGEEE